jgi:anti-anti-sigma regulatory factor
MSDFITSIKENNSIVIIETNGYLNNVGGEAVSAVVYEKMAQGQTKYLINMAATKIVNSIGVSILIACALRSIVAVSFFTVLLFATWADSKAIFCASVV